MSVCDVCVFTVHMSFRLLCLFLFSVGFLEQGQFVVVTLLIATFGEVQVEKESKQEM